MMTLLLSPAIVLALSLPTIPSAATGMPNSTMAIPPASNASGGTTTSNHSAAFSSYQSHVPIAIRSASSGGQNGSRSSLLAIPQTNDALESGQWLREHFNVHSETEWKIRRVPLPGGSEVVIARELRNGQLIAGSRIALMANAQGNLSYVTGQSLRSDHVLPPRVRESPRAPRNLVDIWYPRGGELIAARIELSEFTQEHGSLTRYMNFVSKRDGEVLGRRPALYHAGNLGVDRIENDSGDQAGASRSDRETVQAKIAGWVENPDTTPLTHYYDVPLDNLDPLVLKGPDVEIVQCGTDPWSCLSCASPECPAGCHFVCERCEECTEACDGDADCLMDCEPFCTACEANCADCPELNESCYERFPEATDHGVFPFLLPDADDIAAHTDPHDPFANTQAMQYASRFFERLRQWNWDPNIFDVVGCPNFSDPENNPCRLRAYVNVLTRDQENNLRPLDSAFYAWGGELFMGQGTYVDSAYDMHVLVHEIGHHVTAGWGESDFVGDEVAPERHFTDNFALHEGSSDFYAVLMGISEEMAIYFRNRGGVYQWPRIRDASIPFSCPQNVTGEGHMEGRIWVSAMWDIHNALMDAGLTDDDLFPQIFNGAMAVIRQIPDNQERHFPEASEIVIEATQLVLGSSGADIAASILEERGLRSCDYTIDIAEEPSVTGKGDPEDAKDSRFIFISGSPYDIGDINYPAPPPVEHRIGLSDTQTGVVLYFVPDQWRSSKRQGEALQQEGLVAAALVKQGDDGVQFTFDDDAFVYENDAELRFESQAAPEKGEEWRKIVIDDLSPGERYSIALVSAAEIDLESGLFLLDRMEWAIIEEVSEEEGGEAEGGEEGDPTPSDCNCDPTRGFAGEWTALGFIVLGAPRWGRRRRMNRQQSK